MKDGYYWVRIGNQWGLARWYTGINNLLNGFYMAGSDKAFNTDFFDEIGDYIETPDKYKE